MSYDAISAWWWPYVFIAIAGWIATDLWRWLGVLAGNRLKEDSAALSWVRAVATALVAAVISKLVLYPTGSLQAVPVFLRLFALACGFGAFLLAGKRTYVGILVGVGLLVAGQLVLTGIQP